MTNRKKPKASRKVKRKDNDGSNLGRSTQSDRRDTADPLTGDFGVDTIKKDIENDRYVEIWNIVFSQFNASKEIDRDDYPE